ncbi:MAG: hypothetical protein ACK50Y_04620 [Flavobacteriia bacterium]
MSFKNIKGGKLKFLAYVGLCLFVALYAIAALSYPGGSDFHPDNKGFSIIENYWCELLGRNAKNGEKNVAQPSGILALLTLNSTLTLLWYRISYAIKTRIVLQQLIFFCGIGSVFFSSFVFTNWHDLLIGISVLLGLIAILLTLFLIKNQLIYKLGLLIVFLIVLNVTIYFTHVGIYYLPLLQKFTFVCVLLWFFILNYKID